MPSEKKKKKTFLFAFQKKEIRHFSYLGAFYTWGRSYIVPVEMYE